MNSRRPVHSADQRLLEAERFYHRLIDADAAVRYILAQKTYDHGWHRQFYGVVEDMNALRTKSSELKHIQDRWVQTATSAVHAHASFLKNGDALKHRVVTARSELNREVYIQQYSVTVSKLKLKIAQYERAYHLTLKHFQQVYGKMTEDEVKL